jgi:hypothetical protein
MLTRALVAVSLALSLAVACRADVPSGPTVGSAVPELTVTGVTGPLAGLDDLDVIADREGLPTVYLFVPASRFSRPIARFIKVLDGHVRNVSPEAEVVAVWLTADQQQTLDYLPRAQMSLALINTSLCVFPGDAAGPGTWGVNSQADVTAVVVDRLDQVAATWGFVSVNDTLVRQVLGELRKADKQDDDGDAE